MELANGKINKFYTSINESSNRYHNPYLDLIKNENSIAGNLSILSEYIQSNSVILDIACGQGNLVQAVKEKNCQLFGIDCDIEAIECAKKTNGYKDLFLGSIIPGETSGFYEFINSIGKIDVIILSDILEHLVDPTSILSYYFSLLSDKGIVLISIPNIANSDIMLNLINGCFNYSDIGILDNTHLKFFTKNSFIQWIKQINDDTENIFYADCEYIGATFYQSEYIEKVLKLYPNLYKILGQYENHNGFQILFKLTKIDKNVKALNLQKLLDEKPVDIVKLIGLALEGRSLDLQVKHVKGEEIDLKLKNERIRELESSLNWHIDKVHELHNIIEYAKEQFNYNEKNLSAKNQYIKELEESINWHIDKIKDYNQYIKELEESVNWHIDKIKDYDKYVKELEGSVNWHIDKIKDYDKYVKELEESVNWHIDKIKDLNGFIGESNEYVKNFTVHINDYELLKKEVFNLHNKIYEMENSLSWKITKFLRYRKN